MREPDEEAGACWGDPSPPFQKGRGGQSVGRAQAVVPVMSAQWGQVLAQRFQGRPRKGPTEQAVGVQH